MLRHAYSCVWFCIVVSAGSAIGTTAASGVSLRVGSAGGVMQQPTSQYYHAVYGAYVDVATDSSSFIARATYIERPEFKSAGYSDQDSGGFALIGTKITKAKDHGLLAFLGAGHMNGYIKTTGRSDDPEEQSRSYKTSGLIVSLEYAAQWHGVDLAVGHQSFAGYVDDTQLESYVAWPYTFFLARIGMEL